MSEQEDFYKRGSDKEWRQSIESRLVSLTSAQNTTDRQLDELEQLLEGDPLERNDTGLKGDVKELGVKINEIYATVFRHSEVIRKLEDIEERIASKEKSLEVRLKFWGPIIIAVISSSVLLIREWPTIYARWNHNVTELEEANKKAVHNRPKHKKKHAPVPEVKVEADEEVQQ